MKVVFFSNKGPAREHNEDALFTAGNVISGCSMSFPAEINTENDDKCFIVIDGMGGYEGGERAARIIASAFIENSGRWDISINEAQAKINLILNSAVNKIAAAVTDKPELASMGAALAGIVFCDDKALIFNCGDCRVYRQNSKYLEKLSHDHSVVQELCDAGEIEEDEMRTHVKKNIITACVTSKAADLNIYFRNISINEHERFLVCSDGVWEALPLDEIEACLCEDISDTAKNIAKKLLSLDEHCRDNISFEIIEN